MIEGGSRIHPKISQESFSTQILPHSFFLQAIHRNLCLEKSRVSYEYLSWITKIPYTFFFSNGMSYVGIYPKTLIVSFYTTILSLVLYHRVFSGMFSLSFVCLLMEDSRGKEQNAKGLLFAHCGQKGIGKPLRIKKNS